MNDSQSDKKSIINNKILNSTFKHALISLKKEYILKKYIKTDIQKNSYINLSKSNKSISDNFSWTFNTFDKNVEYIDNLYKDLDKLFDKNNSMDLNTFIDEINSSNNKEHNIKDFIKLTDHPKVYDINYYLFYLFTFPDEKLLSIKDRYAKSNLNLIDKLMSFYNCNTFKDEEYISTAEDIFSLQNDNNNEIDSLFSSIGINDNEKDKISNKNNDFTKEKFITYYVNVLNQIKKNNHFNKKIILDPDVDKDNIEYYLNFFKQNVFRLNLLFKYSEDDKKNECYHPTIADNYLLFLFNECFRKKELSFYKQIDKILEIFNEFDKNKNVKNYQDKDNNSKINDYINNFFYSVRLKKSSKKIAILLSEINDFIYKKINKIKKNKEIYLDKFKQNKFHVVFEQDEFNNVFSDSSNSINYHESIEAIIERKYFFSLRKEFKRNIVAFLSRNKNKYNGITWKVITLFILFYIFEKFSYDSNVSFMNIYKIPPFIKEKTLVINDNVSNLLWTINSITLDLSNDHNLDEIKKNILIDREKFRINNLINLDSNKSFSPFSFFDIIFNNKRTYNIFIFLIFKNIINDLNLKKISKLRWKILLTWKNYIKIDTWNSKMQNFEQLDSYENENRFLDLSISAYKGIDISDKLKEANKFIWMLMSHINEKMQKNVFSLLNIKSNDQQINIGDFEKLLNILDKILLLHFINYGKKDDILKKACEDDETFYEIVFNCFLDNNEKCNNKEYHINCLRLTEMLFFIMLNNIDYQFLINKIGDFNDVLNSIKQNKINFNFFKSKSEIKNYFFNDILKHFDIKTNFINSFIYDNKVSSNYFKQDFLNITVENISKLRTLINTNLSKNLALLNNDNFNMDEYILNLFFILNDQSFKSNFYDNLLTYLLYLDNNDFNKLFENLKRPETSFEKLLYYIAIRFCSISFSSNIIAFISNYVHHFNLKTIETIVSILYCSPLISNIDDNKKDIIYNEYYSKYQKYSNKLKELVLNDDSLVSFIYKKDQ